MAGSYTFRNITTYVVEPDGEPIESLPTKSSLDFSPQLGCLDEAPDDGKQYGRQSKDWTEVNNDHAELDNLDYENSGHTGFAASSSLSKENITGLKLEDSPEFNNSLLTQLQQTTDGGDMSTSLWSWIVGLFPTIVKKSVFSHINSIWDYLWKRDGYLLKYVYPADTTDSLTLSEDKFGNALNFVEGDEIIILIQVPSWVSNGADTNRIHIRVNGLTSATYYIGTSVALTYVYTTGTAQYGQWSTIKLRIIGREIHGEMYNHYKSSTTSYNNVSYNFHTEGADIEAITSITIYLGNTTAKIPAGSIIMLKKI